MFHGEANDPNTSTGAASKQTKSTISMVHDEAVQQTDVNRDYIGIEDLLEDIRVEDDGGGE